MVAHHFVESCPHGRWYAVAARVLRARVARNPVGPVKRNAIQLLGAVSLFQFYCATAIAEICDKGELPDEPWVRTILAGIGAEIWLGPFVLIALRRPWGDSIGGLLAFLASAGASLAALEVYLFRNLSEPVTAAMKRGGCLWEPSVLQQYVMLLPIPVYGAIFSLAVKRLLFPTRT